MKSIKTKAIPVRKDVWKHSKHSNNPISLPYTSSSAAIMFKGLLLALAATHAPVLGHQLQARNAISNDPYPFCNPAEEPNCIAGGKYLVPPLDFSLEGDIGDQAYNQYLPTHTFTLSQWTNNKMPEPCYYWGVTADHWNPADFVVYNVTFSDCPASPWVVCWNNHSPKSISQIATVRVFGYP